MRVNYCKMEKPCLNIHSWRWFREISHNMKIIECAVNFGTPFIVSHVTCGDTWRNGGAAVPYGAMVASTILILLLHSLGLQCTLYNLQACMNFN